jgi:catechol 2,3-dioxygenase-like lactoylglutathione lyase family enzyme
MVKETIASRPRTVNHRGAPTVGIQLSKPALDVGIVTTNAEQMLAFYRDVLGLPAEEPIVFPGHGTVHRLLVGESILRLFESEKALPESTDPNDSIYSTGGIRYLTLAVENLHEVVDACREFGVNISRPVSEIRPGVFATTIQDPDGNWIEMQSR